MKEFDRVIELPTWETGPEDVDTDAWTKRFSSVEDPDELWPIQAHALEELEYMGGLVAIVGVGFGKSLTGLLASHVVECERPVYVHPASTTEALYAEIRKWSEQFDIPENLRLETYRDISHKPESNVLVEYAPDFVILDEAHRLGDKESARTQRFMRYMAENPSTKVAAMSGTMTSRSIKDYAHIVEWTLKKFSPLPRQLSNRELQALSMCADDLPDYQSASSWHWSEVSGFVEEFCEEASDARSFQAQTASTRREQTRKAVETRLEKSRGVVKTSGASVGAPIHIHANRDFGLPEDVRKGIRRAKRKYVLPNGDLLAGAPQAAAARRQLSYGFFYKWSWPDGERDEAWIRARSLWRQKVREVKKYGPDQLDTPALIEQAVESGEYDDLEVVGAWERWKLHKDKPEPETEPVWIDDTVLERAVERALDKYEGPLIWYKWQAVADKINDLFRRDVRVCYARGQDPQVLDADRAVAVSQESHRKGLNLQQFSENVILTPSPQAQTWEQQLGRTHRAGQEADEVTVDVMAHTDKHRTSVEDALENAEYLEDSQGQDQKILIADWSGLKETV